MRSPCLGSLVIFAALVCGAALAADDTASQATRIELHTATLAHPARFEVVGLTEDELSAFNKLPAERQSAIFSVFVDAGLDEPPAIVGKLSVVDHVIRFVPRYPLEPGLRYRAVFNREKLTAGPSKPLSAVFPIAKPDAQPTTLVEHIYPSADQLPDNQLKFYIHFSAPMSRGEAYRHVHLVDANGKEVESVFLELGEELWDGTGQRFTLYFDPGRVKRGLKPREELGPVLHEGRTYSLVVDSNWRDAARVPLKSGARKTFSVGPPDDVPVDPSGWKLTAPAAGSTDPLVVRFGEPLDHAQLQRVVQVVTASAERVPGAVRVTDDESRWEFTPRQPWRAGKYELVADTTLEDLAGNSIGRPFEVDQFGPVQKSIESKTVSVPFTIAPSP